MYADTDFFVALIKPGDWLRDSALRLVNKHQGQIWTGPATAIELLLIAAELGIDPEQLLLAAFELAEFRVEQSVFLKAAHHMKEKRLEVFDSLHAAFAGSEPMISSDKVFDRLGLERIPLEEGG